jgi:hypothetical protein
VADLTYQFRLGLHRGAETYRLTDDALMCSSGYLPLREVAAVRVYSVPGLRSLGNNTLFPPMLRATIRSKNGRGIVLSNLHFVGLGRFEDRTGSYLPFLRALVRGVGERSPGARLVSGMPLAMCWSWVVVFGALVAGLVSIIVVGAIGLIVEKQWSWTSTAFMPPFASVAIGPVSFLRAIWPLRTRRLDMNEV